MLTAVGPPNRLPQVAWEGGIVLAFDAKAVVLAV